MSGVIGLQIERIKQKQGWTDDRYCPVISDEALASCRAIITDEWLDFMGERYRRLAIRYWTGVEFHKYLFCPEVLEREADKKRCYKAFRLVYLNSECVATTTN